VLWPFVFAGLCRFFVDVGDDGLKQVNMPRFNEIRSQRFERKSAFVMNKDGRPPNARIQQSSQSFLLPFQGRRAHVMLREC
jgi:hypothetical protein